MRWDGGATKEIYRSSFRILQWLNIPSYSILNSGTWSGSDQGIGELGNPGVRRGVEDTARIYHHVSVEVVS